MEVPQRLNWELVDNELITSVTADHCHMPLTFLLDLLWHQELIPFNSGGVVAANDPHCILELVSNFSWRNKYPVMIKWSKPSCKMIISYGPIIYFTFILVSFKLLEMHSLNLLKTLWCKWLIALGMMGGKEQNYPCQHCKNAKLCYLMMALHMQSRQSEWKTRDHTDTRAVISDQTC